MKTVVICFMLILCQALAFGQRQSLLQTQVTVSFSNTSIEEILKSLETESLSFVYSPEVFDVKKRVSIKRQNTALASVLTELFVGQSVEMHEMNGQVLLRKKITPKPDSKQEIIDTIRTQPSVSPSIVVSSSSTVQKAAIIEKSEPVPTQQMNQQEKQASLDSLANPTVNDSVDSFGSQVSAPTSSLLAQTSTFIPRWNMRPYEPYAYQANPLALDYSLLLPKFKEEAPQPSIWDEIASENRRNTKREKKEKRATDDKKFRMGLGLYTGFAPLDNLDAFLIGGQIMYYPSIRTGVGFNANALLSKSFYSETLQKDIRVEGGYGGLAIEYVLFPKSVIHINLPLTLGAGGYNYVESEDPFAPIDPENSEAFFMIEVGAELEVNVAKFLKIGAGFSYRSISGSDFLNRDNNQDIIKASALEGVNYGIILKFGRF